MAVSNANCASKSVSVRTGERSEESLRRDLPDAATAVRRYLFGLCGNWDEAEDLAQEALLKVWRKRHSFDGRSNVRTWIFAVARNHWLDCLRRRKVRPREQSMEHDPQSGSGQPTPPAMAERVELAEAVRLAVDKLPEEQREALSLRESEGLTFREIGQLLGVPTATAKSRVRYALLKLADHLKPFGPELQP